MFRQLNIRNKLALVLWGAALLVFAATGVGLALFQSLTLEGRVRQIMEPYAQLVSVGTEAAVAFEDPVRAREILDTLRANPQILAARIVLDDGRVLADFSGSPDAAPRPDMHKAIGIYLGNESVELLHQLPRGAVLHLTMSLEKLRQQMQQALWMFGAGMLALLAITLGLSLVLQQIIIRPIAILAQTAEWVRTRADYGLRVPAAGADEVAQLGQSFNAMMEAVRQREHDLRQLTRFQRAILDNAAHCIISISPAGLVSSFNPAAERLLGYRAADVIGTRTPMLWHDPDEVERRARQLSDELGETIAPGFEVFVARARRNLPDENEWTFIRADRSRVSVLLSLTALRDEQNQITGFVGLANDLTERKRTEEELQRYHLHLEELVVTRTQELARARDAAESANRMKSVFLANMSHELRTPLNGILGYAQIMLRDQSLGESDKARLNVILHSGEHLLTLINDVLDFAKIEAGKLELYLTDFPFIKCLRVIADMVGVKASQKNLDFICNFAPDLPAWVRADEKRLREVLLNLLSNAVKFTDHGKVQLSVSMPVTGQFRFEVQDTGAGISETQLTKLFQPFEQVGDAQRRLDGTGLGLAISRQLVRLMGADIQVESRVGAGSTFWFELKLPVIESETLAAVGPGVAGYAGPRKKILVVDDVAENRGVALDMLRPLGFDMFEAASGREGLEKAQSLQPDLILMDLVMPDMDGLETTRLMRKLPGLEKVPVIAISASVSIPVQESSRLAGVNAFLPKPLDFDSLLAQLAKLLHLNWRYETPQAEPVSNGTKSAVPVALPTAEIEQLYQLAQLGNMKAILLWADHLETLDESYQPFVSQLRELAIGYRSKEILILAARYLDDVTVSSTP